MDVDCPFEILDQRTQEIQSSVARQTEPLTSYLSPRVGLLLSNVISPPFQSSPPHHHLQLFSDFKTIYSGRASFPGLGMGRAFSLTTTGVVMISLYSLPTRASWHLGLIFKGCAFTAHFIAFIASIFAGQSRSKTVCRSLP